MIKGIAEDILKSVYDFSQMTNEELRCKFFQKLEECIDLCNNSADILEWIKNEGLESEVNGILTTWKDDGTLENIINIDKMNRLKEELTNSINELQTKHKNDINVITTKVDTLESNVNTTVDNAINQMNTKVDMSIDEQNAKMNNLKEEITTNFNNQANDFQNNFANLKNEVNEKLNVVMYVKNETELLNAIETAKTTPTLIYIYKDITLNNIIFIPSNTIVKGLGNVTIKASGSINCCFSNFTNNAIGYNGTKNIRIENLTFDGENRTTVALTIIGLGHAENVTIYNCRFKNLHVWHMIELNGVNKGTIEKCSFENYGNVGTSGTEAIQLDCMFNEGVFPWFGNYDNTACKDIHIKDNKFYNIGTTGIGNHSFVEGVVISDLFVENNYFENCTNCINIKDVCNMSIINNKAHNCSMLLFLDTNKNSCLNITVADNHFVGLFTSDIANIKGENRFIAICPAGKTGTLKVSRVVINNNIIESCATHGIGFLANDVTITNNIFRQIYKNAIYHWGGWNSVINNNSCYYVGVEGNNRGFISVGENTLEESKSITINGNNGGNGARIIIGANTNKCLITNNIASVIETNSGTCTQANNIEPF